LPGCGEPDGPPRGALPDGVPAEPGRGEPRRPELSPWSGPYRLGLLTRPHQLGDGYASSERTVRPW